MASKSAVILRPEHRDEFFEILPFSSRMPARDKLVFALSFFQVMRVCEIAQAMIDDILGPRGEILDVIRIAPYMTKGSRGRTIPMHPFVRECFIEFLDVYPGAEWVAISPRDGRQMYPHTLGKAMERCFKDAGFPGCRSHTGRATGITEMATQANLHGCNLSEVQHFAGHKRLETTASYLGPTGNLADLVRAMGSSNRQQGNPTNAAQESGPTYWSPGARVRRDNGPRRAHRLAIAGQPGADGHGRRDEERLVRRSELKRRSRRKLRQTRPRARGR